MKKVLTYGSAIIIGLFGLVTLFLSTSIILDLFDIRAKEGNYVLFIVWANFFSSILYLGSAYGFIKSKKWTTTLLAIATVILIIAFIKLKMYIGDGGIYETKTVGAMIFRITLTLVFTLIAYFTITKMKANTLSR